MRTPLLLCLLLGLSLIKPSWADENLPPTKDRLASCNPVMAMAAAEEIVHDPNTLKEPLNLFQPVLIFFQQGKKDEAVFWFYAAQLRTRYQIASQQGGDSSGELLSVMRMTIGPPILNYAMQNIDNYERILNQVTEWDKTTPNPFKDSPKTPEIEKRITEVYTGFNDFKNQLSTNKNDLEQKARLAAPEIEKTYAQISIPTTCKQGQIDPAYVPQAIDKEWELVLGFAQNNQEVISAAGHIKRVFKDSYAINNRSGDTMPSRYEVDVIGDKNVYALVNVSRTNGQPQFTLACVTSTPLGQRDPFKDSCKQ